MRVRAMNQRVQLVQGAKDHENGSLRADVSVNSPVEDELASTRGSDSGDDLSQPGSDAASDSSSALSGDAPIQAESLEDISFGALVEAQAAFPPRSRKRKLPEGFDEASPGRQRNEHKSPPLKPQRANESQRISTRNSKHAPTILSSKQQVSRKRDVFEPSPALKSRDPRFDPTIQSSNHDRNAMDKANKNYSFLTSYQAAEILDLKAQIKKTKDPDTVAELKREAMSIESKVRNAQARQREKDILQQHKQKEKAAIAAGQKAKPYYLKEGQVKKLAEQERVDGMSKKARDKAVARKQKREKTKQAKSMPRVRRE